MLGYSLDFTQLYFVSKLDLICSLERCSEAYHFVYYTSSGPDITLFIVALFLDLLWAHVVGCAHMGVSKDGLVSHDARQSKITQLHILVLVEKDIARLQVPMQNLVALLAPMALQQSQSQLSYHTPHRVFTHIALNQLSFDLV